MDSFDPLHGLMDAVLEVATAVAPLLLIVALYAVMTGDARRHMREVLVGLPIAAVGLTLFLHGVHIAFLPAGRELGEALGGGEHTAALVGLGFLLGFVATFAEPAVRVMRYEVEEAAGGSIDGRILVVAIALGVGAIVSVALLRATYGFPLWWVLAPGYLLAIVLAFIAPPRFVGIAFDSGGVATGPMAVTFILALSIGVAGGTSTTSAVGEGFGLMALVAIAPIVSVLCMGLLYGNERSDDPIPAHDVHDARKDDA